MACSFVPSGSDSYGEKFTDKEDLLFSVSKQLKRLQEEMEEMKSLHSHNQVSPQPTQKSSTTPSSTSKQIPRVDSDITLPESLPTERSCAMSSLDDILPAAHSCFGQNYQPSTTTFQCPNIVTPSAKESSVSIADQLSFSAEDSPKNVDTLPCLDQSNTPFGISSFDNPTLNVLTQDFSSQQTPVGSFVFGLPTSVSLPFHFTPSNTLLCSVPFCAGSANTAGYPFQFSTNTTVSLGSHPISVATIPSSLYDSAPPLHEFKGATHSVCPANAHPVSCSYHNDRSKSAVVPSSNVFGTLPPFNTVGVPVTANVLRHLPITTSTIQKDFGQISPCASTTFTFNSIDSSCAQSSQTGYLFSHINTQSTSVFQPTSQCQYTFSSGSKLGAQVYSSATTKKTQTPLLCTHTQNQPTSLFQGASPSCVANDSHSTTFSPSLLSLLNSSSQKPTSVSNSTSIPSLSITQIATRSSDQSILYGLPKQNIIADETANITIPYSHSDSPHFEPLVSLSLVDDIKSGEEDEKLLFNHHAKLYRFDNNQWKERGIGEMKILKHQVTGKMRLLMRRDQILKLCCNHYITGNMTLTEMKGSAQLAWCTSCDFSDGVSKPEKFAVKFKHQDTGDSFKQIFEECVSGITNEEHSSSEYVGADHKTNLTNISETGNDNPILSIKSLSLPSKTTLSPNVRNDWTCDTCLVQNKATNEQCVACGSTLYEPVPSPQLEISKLTPLSGWVCCTCLVQNRTSDVQCVACGSVCTKPVSKDSSTFTPPPSMWMCDNCLVQNKAVELQCVACKTHKTTKKKATTKGAAHNNIQLQPDTWNCIFCSTSNFTSLDKCINCNSPRPTLFTKANSTANSTPAPLFKSDQFKFEQKHAVPSESLERIKIDALKSTGLKESATQPKTEAGGTPITQFSPSVLSDNSLSVHRLHSQSNPTVVECDDDKCLERELEVYFTPVVSLPEKIENKTGEETEESLFCDRAKLYRFDDKASNWKERGVGDIKILRNKVTRKSRLLMRRDRVLKICCNHNITAEMTMTSIPSANNTWIWYTSCDFADEEGRPEKFAIKFKYPDSAENFKDIFDECVNGYDDHSSPADILEQEEPAIKDQIVDVQTARNTAELAAVTSEVDDVIVVKVEKPSKDKIELARSLFLPDNFFNYENKVPCPGCRGCIAQNAERQSHSKERRKIAVEHSKEHIKLPSDQGVFGSTLVSDKPVISFADLAATQSAYTPFLKQSSHEHFSHNFKEAGDHLFSTKCEDDPEAKADIRFKAIVSLPEVDINTGEELEDVLFTHRSKLFRFDETVNEWKERGVGDIKLLRNASTKRTRILMRRDQILKVCCNHFITADMKLLAQQERSWMWYTLNDFADEIPRPEKFAVRFKSAVTAQKFKVVFEDCVCKDMSTTENEETCQEKQDSKKISLQEVLAPKPDSWLCSVCSVFNPESINLCMACKAPKPGENQTVPVSIQTDNLHECIPCSSTEVGHDHINLSPLNTTLPTSSSAVSLPPKLRSDTIIFHKSPSPLYNDEDEEVSFSAKGILYCEDLNTKQWKEGSDGYMKIIRNKSSQEKRLLMISSDQNSVVCAHRITSMMYLRSNLEKGRAWIWNGLDNKSSVQKYCIEFYSQDDALNFKNGFGMSFSLPILSKHVHEPASTNNEGSRENDTRGRQHSEQSRDKVSSTGKIWPDADKVRVIGEEDDEDDDDVIFVCEEIPDPDFVKKAEALLLPRSFFLYKRKDPCTGCRGCMDEEDTMHVACDDHAVCGQQAVPELTKSYDASDCNKTSKEKVFSSTGMLSFADVIKQDSDSLSKKLSGFQFVGAGEQLFSLSESKEDDNSETDIVFQPIVSLPETYSVKSWDEDTETLFCHRAKLFRFDGSTEQWKERGVGDMKIVQHNHTKKFRLVMRRDQIFKLCCNHYIAENMKLERLQSDQSWMWFTTSDFSDDKPREEKLAIKFKHNEKGLEFKKIFDECVSKQKQISKQSHNEISSTAVTIASEALFKPDSHFWECKECLIRNRRNETICAACASPKPFAGVSRHDGASVVNCVDVGEVQVSLPQLMQHLTESSEDLVARSSPGEDQVD